jgi:hypothetical protein
MKEVLGVEKLKNLVFTTKFLVFFLCFLLAFPVLINCLMYINLGAGGDENSWISFFGSFYGAIAGGLITGVVAFGIAKHQISEEKNKEHISALKNELPHLISLKYEVEKIIKNFDLAKGVLKSPHIRRISGSYYVEEDVNIELWDRIYSIQEVELQVTLIKLKEYYLRLVKILEYNYNQGEWDLSVLEKAIDYYNEKGSDKTIEEEEDFNEKGRKYSLLLQKHTNMSNKIEAVVLEFHQLNYQEKAIGVLQKLEKRIDKVTKAH